jgi:hypothetical protein
MFGHKKSAEEKLPKPGDIPGLVQKHLLAQGKIDPELVPLLMAVVCPAGSEGATKNIRIFDASEALAKKVVVKDYVSLDEHPDLMIYEGSFDEASKQVNLQEKKTVSSATKFFTEVEIIQQIEALHEPGSTVFFFQARGTAHGGPLGMGTAVIELNPNFPGKGQKKYIMYDSDVIDLQPVGKGHKIWDSNEPKKIAQWVMQAYHKRLYRS